MSKRTFTVVVESAIPSAEGGMFRYTVEPREEESLEQMIERVIKEASYFNRIEILVHRP